MKTVHVIICGKEKDVIDGSVNAEIVRVGETSDTALSSEITKKKVKKFVFASSSSVYGNQKSLPLVEDMIPNPLVPYSLQKLIGEE